MGRSGKPTKTRKLGGSRAPKGSSSTKVPAVKLKPPKWLPPFAREEWFRVVPALEKVGVLTILDETAMVNYVVAYDRFRRAEAVLQEHGFTTHTAAGGFKKRPELAVIAEAQTTMRRFMEAFGLTPASRARLNLNSGKDDTAAAFLFEKAPNEQTVQTCGKGKS